MYDFKPDFEATRQRMSAFWQREIIDRPLVQFMLYKDPQDWVEYPTSIHETAQAEWEDIEYQAEWALANLNNQLFLGDSLPVAWPNLGPDVFASFYGCPIRYDRYGTSWSEPILKERIPVRFVKFNWDGDRLRLLRQMTAAFLQIGKGKFITGMSDWHTSGDCLAALRGISNFAMDLIRDPGWVKGMLARILEDYQQLYLMFYEMLAQAGQPITTWVPLIGEGKFYMVSNDFSIMVSPAMYRDFFLEVAAAECQFLDHSLYHLDGPGALRHLDNLLDLPGLNGVQFVPTPGQDTFAQWRSVYQKIQNKGKCVQITCMLDEIEDILDSMKPQGLYLVVQDVPSVEVADNLVRRLEHWTCQGV